MHESIKLEGWGFKHVNKIDQTMDRKCDHTINSDEVMWFPWNENLDQIK